MSQAQVQYNSTQYDRIRALGKGSFGTATVHRRRADCSLVVLKEIDLQKFKGEREKMSAINEARIMSTLSHVNIIKFHNAFTTDTKLIIEMEYASIGTLANYLTFQVQPLEEREILIIFRQIVSGVYYLHSKDIVHLDLKMTNIFITIDGLVKIGDFGISQYMNTASNPHPQAMVPTSKQQVAAGDSNKSKRPMMTPTKSTHLGTLAYSSPERCLGERTDFKSDIWSLGCILYELITSKPLFAGTSLPDLVLSITRIQYNPIRRPIMPLLLETFEQTIARDPEDRPSAKELLLITGQLLSRLQLNTRTTHNHMKQHHHHNRSHRFELSTEVALFAGHQQDEMSQLNYLHSLVYQVRLDSKHIQVDRVNLPQTKRIKEICKGKSHYLVLTYDNIVYGWGSKSCGQLGACGLSSGSGSASSYGLTGVATFGHRATRSARSSVKETRDKNSSTTRTSNKAGTAVSSLASSSQTIAGSTTCTTTPASASASKSNINNHNSQQHVNKQLIMSILQESKPTTRPFIMNELNNRKIVQVAAGKNFSVFLSRTGIVMTCGDGSSGCLGRGTLSSSFTPCMVEGLLNADVVSIGCGPEHVVAVCGNGRAFAWGNAGHGRLGVGAGLNHQRARRMDNDTAISSLNLAGPGMDSTSGQSRGTGQARGKYVLQPEPVQFEANVFIKSVFCGDRCTVFIDSDDRCWACGENRFNKLGLDVKRRFKKGRIVERCLAPTEIDALSKYKIVTCNIGQNHTSFISNEGKLLVFGQDIDHTYRLRSNIISSRDSHRRISYQLQNRANKTNLPRKPPPPPPPPPPQPPAPSSLHGRRCDEITSRSMNMSSNSKDAYKHTPRTATKFNRRLSKLQRHQMDSYMKKSRSNRRMPFDCTIGVSSRPKFTLVLTSDNRVYFWGVRSHKKEEDEKEGTGSGQLTCPVRAQNEAQNRAKKRNESIEPQLVTNCYADECFIKIGETNSSLMSSIQTLGSDQPIIHAQDPRLVAKSLADLWILDYQPSQSTSTSASTCSSSVDYDDGDDQSASSSCCSLSPCSLCTHYGSSSQASNLANSNQNSDRSGWRKQRQPRVDFSMPQCQSHSRRKRRRSMHSDYDEEDSSIEDCMRHDAILEPQPIVSLYVPSMFNHKGCSLNLVDLFCFDNDRFYLILDTSITLQHTQRSQSRPPSGLATGTTQSPQNNEPASRRRLMSVNETGAAMNQIRQLVHNESLSLVNLHQAAGGGYQNHQYSIQKFNSNRVIAQGSRQPSPPPVPLNVDAGDDPVSGLSKQKAPSVNNQHHHHQIDQVENGDGSLRVGAEQEDGCDKDADLDDVNNNEQSMPSGGACDGTTGGHGTGGFSSGDGSNHNNTNDHTVISGGVSLEEPRSLSTFATSLGNHHIIVGPAMRSLEHQEQTLHPLSFGGQNHHDPPFRSHRNSQLDLEAPNVTTRSLLEETTRSESSSCNGTLMNGDLRGVDQEVDSGRLNKLDGDISVNDHDHDDDEFSAKKYLRVGRRKRANRSRDVTINCASNDIDETSSMPSWVRNEFIEQQRQQEQQQDSGSDGMCSQEGDNGHVFEAAMLGLLVAGGCGESSAAEATENNTSMSLLETQSSGSSSDGAAPAAVADEINSATVLDQEELSDQTLAHETYSESIVGCEDEKDMGVKVEDRSPEASEGSARSLYDEQQQLKGNVNRCSPPNQGELDAEPEVGGSGIMRLDEDHSKKPPRSQPPLACSQSHPNMRELDHEENINSDSILRRASILMASNSHDRRAAASGGQANILDCNVYRVSHSHTTMLRASHNNDSVSYQTTNNDTTSIYDNNRAHQLHLSGNMLNSALSSRSNSHNPLIRADFSPKLGFLKEHEQQQHRNNHTHSESHLGLVAQLTFGHSREFHLPANNANSKTRAASSSSLASLRKSLAKLFC